MELQKHQPPGIGELLATLTEHSQGMSSRDVDQKKLDKWLDMAIPKLVDQVLLSTQVVAGPCGWQHSGTALSYIRLLLMLIKPDTPGAQQLQALESLIGKQARPIPVTPEQAMFLLINEVKTA